MVLSYFLPASLQLSVACQNVEVENKMMVNAEQKLVMENNAASAQALMATFRESFMSICNFGGSNGCCYENERRMISNASSTTAEARKERLESPPPMVSWRCGTSSTSHPNYNPESVEPPIPLDVSRALEKYSDIMVDIVRAKLSKRGL